MEGYAKIASLMGHNLELGIFRRFATLNAQNLLYLQAELVHLESNLQQLARADQSSGHPQRLYYTKDWWSLSHSEKDGDDKQWQKVLEIRAKLKEYSTIIAFFHRFPNPRSQLNFEVNIGGLGIDDHLMGLILLSKLEKPRKHDLEFFRDWFRRPQMGNFPLLGLDRHVWGNANTVDLITIRRREGDDLLSRWVTDRFIPVFHRLFGRLFKKPIPHDPESGITHYSDEHILAIVDVVGTTSSATFPVLTIVALYFVSNMAARLGILAGSTACFSLCLALVTHARRIEIFAATAAFAAVQVVFLSVNGGGTSQT